MNINIRNSVFETNSSSMHSLVVSKEEGTYTKEDCENLYINKEGTIKLWDDEMRFDRSPFNVLISLREKAAYAFASFCGGTHLEEEIESDANYCLIQEICINFIHSLGYTNFKGFELPYDYEEIYIDKDGKKYEESYIYEDEDGKSYLGNKEVFSTNQNEKVINCGYIDHQSIGMLESFLKKNNVTLKEFLTQKKYIVIIDGDEYCIFDKMISSHLIDPGLICEEHI